MKILPKLRIKACVEGRARTALKGWRSGSLPADKLSFPDQSQNETKTRSRNILTTALSIKKYNKFGILIIAYNNPHIGLSGPDYSFRAETRWVFRVRQTWVGDIDRWMEQYKSDQSGGLEKRHV